MVTLSDIANRCNTSTATVSYVLGGQGNARRISPETQDMINAVANELGYRRKTQQAVNNNPRIVLFWPEKNIELTIANVITGINAALQFETVPVSLNICQFGYNMLHREADQLNSKKYDAAVILSPNTADMDFLQKKHLKIPTVLINRDLEGYSSVSTDYSEVGKLIAEHAITKGGEDIAMVLSSVPHAGMTMRSQSIYKTCRCFGVNIENKIIYCNNNIDDAYELGIRMIREKKLPRVLICVHDIMAYGMMRAFNESGIKVGKDTEIITAQTSYPQFFAKSTPSITVVDMKIAEISQGAIRTAIDLATGRLTAPSKMTIRPEIIFRESSPAPSFEQLQNFEKLKERYSKY